jgi:prepilin-type N-terminal cleavage/methylation domain-containing protein/prepilin-type processing-associated H-X9-DG protein
MQTRPILTPKPRGGFTLIELLVVIAIIAILAGILIPALAKAKTKTQGIACMNNEKQMLYAWTLYASDYNGIFVANEDNATGGWLTGSLNYNGADANTNINNLMDKNVARLAPYTKDYHIYKCPADKSRSYGKTGDPRVRSISMSQAIGPNIAGNYNGRGGWLPQGGGMGWRVMIKEADVVNASDIWVFSDENPDSINDAGLAVIIDSPGSIVDYPTTTHNNACGFSFIDGHAEIHKWVDKMKSIKVTYTPGNIGRNDWGANERDTMWMRKHTTVGRNGEIPN